MKTVLWRVLCTCLLLASLSGCVSTGTRAVEVGGAVAPDRGERVVIDEVLVVVDVSGSMYGPDKYRLAKELTRSFVSAMPEGSYRAGLLSFASEWTNEWVRHPAVPLDRDALLSKTAQIKWIRGSTPLPGALLELQPGIQRRSGHTAVVIFSDGGADRQKTLDIADHIKNTHQGPLCFYTVHLGHASACCMSHKACGAGDKACSSEDKACSSEDKACSSKEKACSSDDKACSSKDGEKKDCCKEGEKKDCCASGEQKACCSTNPKGEHGDACGSCGGHPRCGAADLNANGHALLTSLTALSDCGHTWEAEEVICNSGMEKMVRTIFFGPGDGDADGDGVPDSLDQCPDTPRGAKVDARGCWVLSGLNFDTDKSDIKPEFEGLLNDVAQVLHDNANVNVRIDGHTDSRASHKYNEGLSERRAASVRAALVARGVDTARLSSQGFGETKPIASNRSEAGRYQNRRVELTPVQ
jgi:outer membrane protein OmpA-like peptidoglycan-associated protein